MADRRELDNSVVCRRANEVISLLSAISMDRTEGQRYGLVSDQASLSFPMGNEDCLQLGKESKFGDVLLQIGVRS